jgi:hypothetical protein
MHRLKSFYSFDLRSLALQRISVAFVLIVDAIIRLTDIEAHYTQNGVLPLGTFNGFKHIFTYFPDTSTTQIIFFSIYILSACLFLLGFKTKVFNFICWWMLCQIHARNPYLLQGGDDLLRIALFWLMLLPTNKRWSIDAYWSKGKVKSNDYFSFANIGYLLLIASVYFFSASLKNSPEWLRDGTAVYYALSLDQLVLPLGKMIYPYPLLLKILTHAVYAIEFMAPILLILPFRHLRNFALFTLLLLHVGIGSTLFVGLFFIIGILTLPALYKGKYLDTIEGWCQKVKIVSEDNTEKQNDTNLLLEITSIAIAMYCLAWNLGNISIMPYELNNDLKKIGYTMRLDQNWGMFSPTVFKDDGWFIAEGVKGGKVVLDVLKPNVPISYEKPKAIVEMFKNDRWRKYSENILFVDLSWLRSHYSKYLWRQWNSHHSQKIEQLNLIYMKEVSGPNYNHYDIKKDTLDIYKAQL